MIGSFNTARAYLKAGNVAAARKIADEAMDENPDRVAVWDLLVDIEFAEKRYDKALDLTKRGLEQWPDHAGLRFHNALAFLNLKRPKDAAKAIEGFEADFPYRKVETHLLHTVWQIHFGSLKRARFHRKQFEESAPDSPHIAMLDSMIAAKADDMLGKERASKQMAENAPMDADAYARLAYAQFDLFKLGAARRSARAALAAEPTRRRVEAILWLSWLVYFPPFFVAHAVAWLGGMRRSLLPRWLAAVVYLPFIIFAVVVIALFLWPAARPFLPAGSGLVVILSYVAWPFLRNALLTWFGKRSEKPHEVKLKDY